MALNLATLLESCLCGLELADMVDDIVFDLQVLDHELHFPLLEESLIIRLATTLGMDDSLFQDDDLLTFLNTFTGGENAQHSITVGDELGKEAR